MHIPTAVHPGPKAPASPELIIDTAFAFQRTQALKSAIELDIFTAVGEGSQTVPDIASARGISERGCRILCDFLTTCGFLTKNAERYALSADSAAFLDRRSPMYLGSTIDFMTNPEFIERTQAMTATIRAGTLTDQGTTAPDHQVWPLFAQAMAPLQALPAMLTAELAPLQAARETRVLDIAAGHGEFGIAIARRFPLARITALDWASVLEVTRKRVAEAGFSDRLEEIAGDAFSASLGSGYDLILVPNFLHHFDEASNITFLRRVAASLAPEGRILIVEFVPNADRVSPPMAARFAYTMLTTTPRGDAYTRAELERMLTNAGFTQIDAHPLLPTPQTAITARKA